MRKVVIAALIAGMAAPTVAAAEASRTEEVTYALGGTVLEGRYSLNDETQVWTGPMVIPATPRNGGPGGFDEVHVEIDDLANPNVYAYYSWHASRPISETPLGGTPDDLGSGTFCKSATLDIPEKAGWLRVALNAPIAYPHANCLPPTATAGTLTATFQAT